MAYQPNTWLKIKDNKGNEFYAWSCGGFAEIANGIEELSKDEYNGENGTLYTTCETKIVLNKVIHVFNQNFTEFKIAKEGSQESCATFNGELKIELASQEKIEEIKEFIIKSLND